MRRRSRAGGETVKTRRRKTLALKRGNARRAMRRRSSSAANLRKQLDDRTRELKGALEQQAATADVLKVISRSTFELQPVLDTLVESAARLCEADSVAIARPRDGVMQYAAKFGLSREFEEIAKRTSFVSGRGTVVGRVLLAGKQVQIADVEADPEYTFTEGQRVAGFRTVLGVPLEREGETIGVIVLLRTKVRPFTDKQIELVRNFAAQAVIAIENTRLLKDLRESLDRQTATADILRVIAGTPEDSKRALDTIAETASRMFDVAHVDFRRLEGNLLRIVSSAGPTMVQVREALPDLPLEPTDPVVRSFLDNRQIAVEDRRATLANEHGEIARALLNLPLRSQAYTPLAREGKAIGVMIVNRSEVRPFQEHELELMKGFADQAVIAIENARLLNELRESLQQQTATADVLKVISRAAFDLQTVLDTLVESATRVCNGDHAGLTMREADVYRYVATYALANEFFTFLRNRTLAPGRDSIAGRTALEGKVVHVADLAADPEYRMPEAVTVGKIRTTLGVPLLRDGVVIGTFTVNRQRVEPFTQRQIELVQTFADQAVIAIENARLLNELRQRTTDLAESLEQQTATSKVLDVISRSAFDLQAVFETVAESSVRLCGADRAFIYRFDGELLRLAVAFNTPEKLKDFVSQNPIRPGRDSASARAALERRTIHIHDVQTDPEYTYGTLEDLRTILAVPILKGDNLSADWLSFICKTSGRSPTSRLLWLKPSLTKRPSQSTTSDYWTNYGSRWSSRQRRRRC
jgi:GAF domain-containing protein